MLFQTHCYVIPDRMKNVLSLNFGSQRGRARPFLTDRMRALQAILVPNWTGEHPAPLSHTGHELAHYEADALRHQFRWFRRGDSIPSRPLTHRPITRKRMMRLAIFQRCVGNLPRSGRGTLQCKGDHGLDLPAWSFLHSSNIRNAEMQIMSTDVATEVANLHALSRRSRRDVRHRLSNCNI